MNFWHMCLINDSVNYQYCWFLRTYVHCGPLYCIRNPQRWCKHDEICHNLSSFNSWLVFQHDKCVLSKVIIVGFCRLWKMNEGSKLCKPKVLTLTHFAIHHTEWSKRFIISARVPYLFLLQIHIITMYVSSLLAEFRDFFTQQEKKKESSQKCFVKQLHFFGGLLLI